MTLNTLTNVSLFCLSFLFHVPPSVMATNYLCTGKCSSLFGIYFIFTIVKIDPTDCEMTSKIEDAGTTTESKSLKYEVLHPLYQAKNLYLLYVNNINQSKKDISRTIKITPKH